MSELERVRASLRAAAAAHELMAASGADPVAEAGALLKQALADGHQVLAFGNGGSATDAQHFVAELVGRFTRERGGLSAVALTADTAVLTSIANDYGFDAVFARQVDALGQPGDVAVGITTSGRSPNVNAALDRARARGLRTIALTGRDGGDAGPRADVHVNVPADDTARIQEVHRTVLHVLCDLIEN